VEERGDSIYRRIPDFGGFVVKANSEGQPGSARLRSHPGEGANVIADALAPHGGIVFWRAFVYSEKDPTDRAKQAYNEFKPLDGKFRDNVFRPDQERPDRFSAARALPIPCSGDAQDQPGAGGADHQGISGPDHALGLPAGSVQGILDWDTMAKGKGSTVTKVIDGSLEGHDQSAMVGVSNIGDDRNWTGANSRKPIGTALAAGLDPDLSAEQIAREWLGMTFTNDPAFVNVLEPMMIAKPGGGGGLL
jgi:alpha-glucuronidase